MARRIVITSGKGGVGKSTIVSLLGYAIASLGKKVLLVDMDFGLNNLDVLMGIENKIVYDIIDVIEGRCLPKQAIIEDFLESNLSIFPSTHCFCKRKFGSNELMDIISQVEYMFDYVIIDCPAGIDGGFKRAVEFNHFCSGFFEFDEPFVAAVSEFAVDTGFTCFFVFEKQIGDTAVSTDDEDAVIKFIFFAAADKNVIKQFAEAGH